MNSHIERPKHGRKTFDLDAGGVEVRKPWQIPGPLRPETAAVIKLDEERRRPLDVRITDPDLALGIRRHAAASGTTADAVVTCLLRHIKVLERHLGSELWSVGGGRL